MPPRAKKPTPPPPPRKTPYEVAVALYGDDFDVQTTEAYQAAAARWSELDRAEQTYALGHLAFLAIRSLERLEAISRAQVRVSTDGTEALGRVGDVLEVAIEKFSLDEDDEPEEGEEHGSAEAPDDETEEHELVVEDD